MSTAATLNCDSSANLRLSVYRLKKTRSVANHLEHDGTIEWLHFECLEAIFEHLSTSNKIRQSLIYSESGSLSIADEHLHICFRHIFSRSGLH